MDNRFTGPYVQNIRARYCLYYDVGKTSDHLFSLCTYNRRTTVSENEYHAMVQITPWTDPDMALPIVRVVTMVTQITSSTQPPYTYIGIYLSQQVGN